MGTACNRFASTSAPHEAQNVPGPSTPTRNMFRFGDILQHNGISYEQLTENDLIDSEFLTLEEADKFYRDYASAMGFGVRVRDGRWSVVTDKFCSRLWVCDKEGERAEKYINSLNKKRCPRGITRVNCPAAFRIGLCRKCDCYVVKKLCVEHNHSLATPREAPLIRSHRSIPNDDLFQATSMRGVSIRTCQIYEYMVDRAGGYRNVGYTIKDLYNKVNCRRREILFEGDIEAALAYLSGKVDSDPELYCKFSVDEENKLVNLFWRDSQSLVDYTCFGDVVLFDSTYKTNYYEKPLVLFVGANNHLSSTIFGCAILGDETKETYTWLLETFVSSMRDKRPESVITDGDLAMRNAIDAVLPGVPHRLCGWHITKNLAQNLKDPNLIQAFKRCLWATSSPPEFEMRWTSMVEEFGESEWLKNMYEIRHKWAEGYCRQHFWGRMRSTQRCEGMNRFVKDFLKSGPKLFEVIPAIDRGLARLRNSHVIEDFQMKNSKQVLTTHLNALERHAANLYTDKVFKLVREEINKVASLVTAQPVPFGKSRMYVIHTYGEEHVQFKVLFHHIKGILEINCTCNLLKSQGFPCCHVINVMKYENLKEFPESLILKRWTKSAKESASGIPLPDNIVPDEARELARYNYLSTSCNKLCFLASRTEEGFNLLNNELSRLAPLLEGFGKQEGDINLRLRRNDARPNNIVRDPNIVRTKGTQDTGGKRGGNGRKCGTCDAFGHDRRNCPKSKGHRRGNKNRNSSRKIESDGDAK